MTVSVSQNGASGRSLTSLMPHRYMRHTPSTTVVLSERIGEDSRHAELTVNDDGSIAIRGHELGPSVEIISSDGEFEWFLDVSASDARRVDVDAMTQAMIDSGTPFSTARAWLDEAAVPYTYYSV